MAQQFYLAAITVVLLGGSPAIVRSSNVFPRDLELPPGASGLYNLTNACFPWHAYVTDGESICSGTIIHNSWVMVLRSCEIVEENRSDIKVHAGGATPDEVRQVVNAEIHHDNGQLARGFALLHLNDSLDLDEYARPARLRRSGVKTESFRGIAAGFLSKDNQIHLKGYRAAFDSTACPSSDFLCGFRLDLPTAESTVGIDFLEIIEHQDIGSKLDMCLIGGKIETIGNVLDKYYPIVDALPWLQDETGLKFVPEPPASECGLLE